MLAKTKIIEIVSQQFGTTPNTIRGKSRNRRASHGRDASAYLMYLHNFTHEEIARSINRSRSGASASIYRVHSRIDSDAYDCVMYCKLLEKVCQIAGVQMEKRKK
jgi:chromosomal replication initiation ATPase DnaA|tara:strand:- start:617 stop:931 length:315 start_codon:yes stop_codon:yes gene_type:complete